MSSMFFKNKFEDFTNLYLNKLYQVPIDSVVYVIYDPSIRRFFEFKGMISTLTRRNQFR